MTAKKVNEEGIEIQPSTLETIDWAFFLHNNKFFSQEKSNIKIVYIPQRVRHNSSVFFHDRGQGAKI